MPPSFSIPSFGDLCFILQISAKEGGWKKVKAEAGVEVFEKKIDGKVAFRGIGEIEGEPAKLVGVLENPARWKDWIDNFKSGRLLEKKTDYHKVFYQSFDSPFQSASNLIYESKISCEDQGRTGRVEIAQWHASLPKPLAYVSIDLCKLSDRGNWEREDGSCLRDDVRSRRFHSWVYDELGDQILSGPVRGLRREIKRADQRKPPSKVKKGASEDSNLAEGRT